MDDRLACRTCLSKQWVSSSKLDDLIKSILEECLSVKVQSQTDIICDECRNILLQFNEFKQRFFHVQLTIGENEVKEEMRATDGAPQCAALAAFVNEEKSETAKYEDEREDDDIDKHVIKAEENNDYLGIAKEMIKRLRERECAQCGKVFKQQLAYTRHMSVHDERPTAIACPYCKHSTNDARYLHRHIARKHADAVAQLKCRECAQTFHIQMDLDKHVRNAHVYACPHCNKPRKNIRRFFYHIACCRDRRSHVNCPQCQKQVLITSLAAHVRTVHVKTDRKKMCPICGNKILNMTTHMKRHDERNRNAPNAGKMKCRFCGDFFDNLIEIYEHQSKVHRGERESMEAIHRCHVCDKKFSLYPSLRTHLKYVHSDNYAFKCTVCTKAFKMKSQLVTHMRYHLNERRYACELCDRSYHANSKLRMHMRTHTGEKPFECNICAKAFIRSDALRIHVKSHSKFKLDPPPPPPTAAS